MSPTPAPPVQVSVPALTLACAKAGAVASSDVAASAARVSAICLQVDLPIFGRFASCRTHDKGKALIYRKSVPGIWPQGGTAAIPDPIFRLKENA